MHAGLLSGLAHTEAIDHRLSVNQPSIATLESGQRRSGRRIECLMATRAAIALQASFLAPPVDMPGVAMRAGQYLGGTLIHNFDSLGCAGRLIQRLPDLSALLCGQTGDLRKP
ncbi:hypothetical protein D3C85_1395410 [compost metagenome]